jgi:c-di-GMP-binding flagellar brake protein YcgR
MTQSETPDQGTVDDFRIQDEVRVGTRLEGRGVSFRGTVIGVQELELWIGLPEIDERLAAFEPGQPLNVATPRGAKALVVDTIFTRHIGPRRGRIFAATRPGVVRETQLRAYVRIDTDLPVEISASARGKLITGVGQTVDLSAGGACFESNLPLVVGDRLTLKVTTNPLEASADAVVVRIDQPDRKHGRPVQWIAVRFVSILEADQDRITRYIYNETRWRLKHGEPGV